MILSIEDSLPRVEGEPEGHHLRETTETGYPLMGSSPAERAELIERAARIHRKVMRDHPFEGEGKYCRSWGAPASSGNPEVGVITFRMMCGYSRETHPEVSK